jgi:hypothetical protein
VKVAAGDVALLPAGTGHCRIEADGDFLVIGAYPPRQDFRVCRTAPTTETIQTIAKLGFPKSDPIGGADGALKRLWVRSWRCREAGSGTARGGNAKRAVAHDRPCFGAARAPETGNNNAG